MLTVKKVNLGYLVVGVVVVLLLSDYGRLVDSAPVNEFNNNNNDGDFNVTQSIDSNQPNIFRPAVNQSDLTSTRKTVLATSSFQNNNNNIFKPNTKTVTENDYDHHMNEAAYDEDSNDDDNDNTDASLDEEANPIKKQPIQVKLYSSLNKTSRNDMSNVPTVSPVSTTRINNNMLKATKSTPLASEYDIGETGEEDYYQLSNRDSQPLHSVHKSTGVARLQKFTTNSIHSDILASKSTQIPIAIATSIANSTSTYFYQTSSSTSSTTSASTTSTLKSPSSTTTAATTTSKRFTTVTTSTNTSTDSYEYNDIDNENENIINDNDDDNDDENIEDDDYEKDENHSLPVSTSTSTTTFTQRKSIENSKRTTLASTKKNSLTTSENTSKDIDYYDDETEATDDNTPAEDEEEDNQDLLTDEDYQDKLHSTNTKNNRTNTIELKPVSKLASQNSTSISIKAIQNPVGSSSLTTKNNEHKNNKKENEYADQEDEYADEEDEEDDDDYANDYDSDKKTKLNADSKKNKTSSISKNEDNDVDYEGDLLNADEDEYNEEVNADTGNKKPHEENLAEEEDGEDDDEYDEDIKPESETTTPVTDVPPDSSNNKNLPESEDNQDDDEDYIEDNEEDQDKSLKNQINSSVQLEPDTDSSTAISISINSTPSLSDVHLEKSTETISTSTPFSSTNTVFSSTNVISKTSSETELVTTTTILAKDIPQEANKSNTSNNEEEISDQTNLNEFEGETEDDDDDDDDDEDEIEIDPLNEYNDGSFKNDLDLIRVPQPGPATPSNTTSTLNSIFSLKGLIKSPALLAGIFGGLLVGIVTALLLLFLVIYRMKQRKFGDATYMINTSSTLKSNNSSQLTKSNNRRHKLKTSAKKNKQHPHSMQHVTLLSSSSLSPSKNLSSTGNTSSSNTTASLSATAGLLYNGNSTITSSRLLKYSAHQANTLRMTSSSVLSSDSASSPTNHEGSFNYAYIKAPTKEFYA